MSSIYKENLIKNIHKIFREDEFIVNLMEATGLSLDFIDEKIKAIGDEFFFDTMGEIGIEVLERQLDFKTVGDDITSRREQLEARWKTAGKCDAALLTRIANSWRNGEVEVSFKNGDINIVFSSIIGIPNNLDTLKLALNEAKPAHLGIEYIVTLRAHKELRQFQHIHLRQYTHKELREKENI